MRRVYAIAAALMLIALAGCNGARLSTGGYYMSWDVAGKRELQTVRAGVASHEQDVVVETANWENQHLPLKGRMRGGRVHLESTGARGRDVEQVELNGRILSDVEAAGEFHYTRNGQEVLSGGWQLLRQDVYRRRKAALEPAE